MPASLLTRFDTTITADVVVVGAGSGGCYALHELRRQGYTVKLLEAGSDFGGVWHFNRYPGARVDSETPTYQLNIPNVWESFNFSQRFPSGDELRQYFAHLDETLDLRRDAIFNARVSKANFDPEKNSWSFVTMSGLTATSRFAIFAAGSTNKAYIPDFPQLSRFKGAMIHPSAWPGDIDFKGKKIGIIGQGSSGVQILQEVAKEECQVSVFIRTPCTGIPMRQRSISLNESNELKNMYEDIFHKAKYSHFSAHPWDNNQDSFHDQTKRKRHALYEKLWSTGGFGFFAMVYADYSVDKEANSELYDFWAGKVRARVTDPVKRDMVAPLKQYQWIGTKRAIFETDYYEIIDRPNVSLVDLKTTPIKEFTPNGLMTSDGNMHELDIVIVATGYDSVTGSLFDMKIHDKHGVLLQKKWQEGIRTYLGMMTPGVPNAFFLYGPGKRREPLLWYGGVPTWWEECSEALKDWSRFTVVSK